MSSRPAGSTAAVKFEEIRQGDPGRDGGGIYRNIARETRIPNILTKGKYSTLEWAEICKLFSSKPTDERIQICLVDTVVINRGDVEMYLYTNSAGYVSRKPVTMQAMQKIRDEFCSFIDIIQPNKHIYVAIAHYSGRPPVPLDLENFNSICMGSTPLDLELLQVFIPSKGNLSSSATYKTDYWLDRFARPILKTIRIGVKEEISGSKNRDTTPSMNRKLNTLMETYCRHVVNCIQEAHQCSVVRLSIEFVEDSHGKIWLMRSTECLFAIEKIVATRSISPDNLKVARTSLITSADSQDMRPSSGTVRAAHTVGAGHFSEERIQKRKMESEKYYPSDDIVQNILMSHPSSAEGPRPRSKLSPVRAERRVKLSDKGGYADIVGSLPPPTATLNLVSSAGPSSSSLNTSVFGSSQLHGCPGDFCNFDLSFIENKDLVSGSANGNDYSRSDLSDFRRRLLLGSMSTEDENDNTSLQASGAFKENKVLVTDHRSSLRNPPVETKKIPYRIIIQTRQEMPLVNRLLRRIRRGDDGRSSSLSSEQKRQLNMYVTEDNYSDLAVSGKLPSHYYQDVNCCDTCFKIYKIITDARTSAIKMIEKKRDKKRKALMNSSDDLNRSVDLTSTSIDSFHTQVVDTSIDIPQSDSQKNISLQAALQAIESLTKTDIAEIKTMSKPPAAVEVVMEAVLLTLTGKTFTFPECRKLLSGGESFLLMLREFQLEDMSDARLRLIEPYVDNPVFRPENVLPISSCAAKFCAWVLGVVQAARWQRGLGHKRSDYLQLVESPNRPKTKSKRTKDALVDSNVNTTSEDLTFLQKLERKKAKREQTNRLNTSTGKGKSGRSTKGLEVVASVEGTGSASTLFTEFNKKSTPSQNYISRSLDSNLPKSNLESSKQIKKDKEILRREQIALLASQKKSSERLASHNKSEGNLSTSGIAKEFRCWDGITKMTYIVLGNVSLDITRCNFIMIHDFFDTCDATAIAFKPIVQRHPGSQIFCFNYPGQANTVWPRPSAVERQRGATEQLINNEWIADRLHELLQHAEEDGDILLTNPFHLVGIGNGASIAAAFALKYGNDSLYAHSLRSVVSINGFLYPDPQLAAILHSASQVFESTPHNRPDIPVSYWSRFVFSEEYLSKINPNLALNIYTAVSNPITNDGRAKITRGSLKHKDLRGYLNPDKLPVKQETVTDNSDSDSDDSTLRPVRVPMIILQSTDNMLVNASNVDTFLSGRQTKHLWSHQQNIVTSDALISASDSTAQWVGKLCNNSSDYAKFSLLGKQGLNMLLDSLDNPRGAFVMWTRAGHALYQENKTAILDLIDALAYPSSEYYGLLSRGKQKDTPLISNVVEMEVPVKSRSPKKKIKVDSDSEQEDDDIPEDGQPEAESKEGIEENGAQSPSHDDDDEMVLFKIATPRRSSKDIPSDEGKNEDTLIEDQEVLEPDEDSKEDLHVGVQQGEDLAKSDDPTEVARVPPISSADFKENIEVVVSTNVNQFDSHPLTEKDQSPESSLSPIEASSPKPILKKSLPENVQKSSQIKSEPIIMQPAPIHPDLPKKTAHFGDSQIQSPPTISPKAIIEPSKLQESLNSKLDELEEKNQRLVSSKQEEDLKRIERLSQEQEARRKQYKVEDDELLTQLEKELESRRKEREKSERLRRLEIQQIEDQLVKSGIVPEYVPEESEPTRVRELPDMKYGAPAELPAVFTESKDAVTALDRMLIDEENAKKRGIMSMEKYEEVKAQMLLAQINRDQKTRHMEAEEQQRYIEDCARFIQRVIRGHIGRMKAIRAAKDRMLKKKINKGVTVFQARVRGGQGRKKAALIKKLYLANLLQGDSVVTIQRIIRGFIGRKFYRRKKRFHAARNIQRVFRGHIGRMVAARERERLAILKRKNFAATKIQSTWKMKVAKEEFRSMRIHLLAAVEIQRMYRGYLGRKTMKRRREWESATPGPERIKLGLKLIEESKVAFERQQEEIDALHRAQERAEARVSHIHAELKESEKELVILERELQEIDQIERDLAVMTHERDVLAKNIKDAAGMPRTAIPGHESAVMGKEPGLNESGDEIRRKKAEAYALELTIQIKRAEREKKRQELETEFASVFQEVEKKRKALERLEASLADMESTRERKDREFRRLQKNLMQLLMEQKQELDDLREKGIELETATATTAAAAVATAKKAKEHEKQSTAMFMQTEELMKFQFMSMSLSYFSSLNMLKQLRDMNSDTTAAAVASSADAAAAAAAAATAANLPNMKKLHLGADDFVSLNIQKKRAELAAAEKAEKEVRNAKATPLPTDVLMWGVDDVARWMESLSLGQYCAAFKEATVDGPFLMELREEDLIQVLGVQHKLHVRKIMVSREKLKPLTKQEIVQKEVVEHEELADRRRSQIGVPDLDTVFSQARNGRLKRLEESLNLGFNVDTEDTKGNTLLLVAAQNSNRKMVEMLIARGAAINHQNAQGNTALHFAMSFDKEGLIAEYLIQNGADDTIENVDGLTPYDGVK